MVKTLIKYKLFENFKEITAFTTHKQTFGYKINPRFTGNPVSEILNNRKNLAEILGVEPGQFVFPVQKHTDCIADISNIPLSDCVNTDALVTSKPGICLCIQTADCVPILLFDPAMKVIAAIHAGWRGTVKNIAGKTVQKICDNYNSNPLNIRAIVGPSIGPELYEVGDEVVNAVESDIPVAFKTLHIASSGKYHFNLWEANRQLLINCGLDPENIEIYGQCTFQKNELYFSARREGIQTGRMVSGIMLL